jgi:hypothetical protein
MLDLEDAVPPDAKEQARAMIGDVLAERPAWVRIDAVGTPLAAADLDAIGGLDDDAGLRTAAEAARSLGFFGKSAIHPRQLPVLHNVFTPSAGELQWARACWMHSTRVATAFAPQLHELGARAIPDGCGPRVCGARLAALYVGLQPGPFRQEPARLCTREDTRADNVGDGELATE